MVVLVVRRQGQAPRGGLVSREEVRKTGQGLVAAQEVPRCDGRADLLYQRAVFKTSKTEMPCCHLPRCLSCLLLLPVLCVSFTYTYTHARPHTTPPSPYNN